MARVPTDSIVPLGVSGATPFTTGALAVITLQNPPTVGASILSAVTDSFGDHGYEFTEAGNFGFLSDGGNFGIEIRSEVGGGGAYLTDVSQTGVYLTDESDNGAGIYLVTEDKGPTHYNSGIYISQDSTDSAGIFIEERSTSGNAVLDLTTVNGDIELKPRGAAHGRIVLDPATVTRFGAFNAAPPIAEVGAKGFVFGQTYAVGNVYMQAAGDAMSAVGYSSIAAAGPGFLRVGRVNGTLAAPTVVTQNQQLGQIDFYGYDGTTWVPTANIKSFVGTNPLGAAERNADLEFFTVPPTTTVPVARMSIGSNGNVVVAAPTSAPLGTFVIAGDPTNGIPIGFTNATNGSGASAGTLTNAPVAGNPAFWLKITIAGVTRRIPCW